MSVIRVEAYDAVRTQDITEFRRRTTQWKRQIEKLPISLRIRGESVTETAEESLSEFFYALNTLDDYMATGRFAEAKMMKRYVEGLYRNCSEEFVPGGLQPIQ